jgi:dTMP kinase
MTSGLFIVIDGTDGSGKGTQAKKLVERLQQEGRAVELLDFPRYGSPSAHFVEKYLRGEYGGIKDVSARAASYFYALDRYDASFELRQKLAEGTIVISNRYTSASKGHQTAKIDDLAQRQAFIDWLNELEYETLGIPKPHLTILLRVPWEIGYELVAKKDERGYLDGRKRDIHEADRDHLRAAEQAYSKLPEMDRHENWQLIECVENGQLLSINDIHQRLWSVVRSVL